MVGRTKEEIDAIIAQSTPQFQQMDQRYAGHVLKWQNEIAMLERRVHDCHEDVDLGNGDRIAVRTALSEEEMLEMGAIEERLMGLEKGDPERSDLTYRQLELMTANPYLTADWFKENKDKWPVNDALVVLIGFSEKTMLKRLNRVKDLEKFRTE